MIGRTLYITKGGNEEGDIRLQVVELLTALSYCVGSSFFRVPALDLGSLSLLSDACQQRNLETWQGGYGLFVGEWVVTGCVVLSLLLTLLSIFKLPCMVGG